MSAKCCADCGSTELTKGAESISLRIPTMSVACFILLLLAKLVVANGLQFLGYALALASYILSFLPGFSVIELCAAVLPVSLILVWIGYCFGRIFGTAGNNYFKFVAWSVQFVGQFTMMLLKLSAQTAGRLVVGSRRTEGGEK